MAKTNKKPASTPTNYDFCLPITLIISGVGKEKVVKLDILGQFETINDTLIPKPLDYEIAQINDEISPKNISPDVLKLIGQYLKDNPVKIRDLVLKSINVFANECATKKN